MESVKVRLTDAGTSLVFHLPEGTYTLHTSSVNRPSGKATEAVVRPKVKRKVLVGYVVEEIVYERGRTQQTADGPVLDLALVNRRGT